MVKLQAGFYFYGSRLMLCERHSWHSRCLGIHAFDHSFDNGCFHAVAGADGQDVSRAEGGSGIHVENSISLSGG